MANFRSYTATQVIQNALREISELRPGQSTSVDVNNELLNTLNDMLDLWQLDSRKVWAIRPDPYTLTAGVQFYLIGPGAAATVINGVQYGAFNTVRPLEIKAANWVDNTVSPTVRRPIEVLNYQQWAGIAVQQIPFAIPLKLWYDRNFSETASIAANVPAGLGTIRLWPGPLAAYQIELFTTQSIAQLLAFVDLTTAYAFPPGYAEAIGLSFAERIGPRMATYLKIPRTEFYGEIFPDIKRMARAAREAIESYNSPEVFMEVDPGFRGSQRSSWNYAIGESNPRTR